jgi:hypothetical protein
MGERTSRARRPLIAPVVHDPLGDEGRERGMSEEEEK